MISERNLRGLPERAVLRFAAGCARRALPVLARCPEDLGGWPGDELLDLVEKWIAKPTRRAEDAIWRVLVVAPYQQVLEPTFEVTANISTWDRDFFDWASAGAAQSIVQLPSRVSNVPGSARARAVADAAAFTVEQSRWALDAKGILEGGGLPACPVPYSPAEREQVVELVATLGLEPLSDEECIVLLGLLSDFRGRFDQAVALARELAQRRLNPASEPNAGIEWLAKDRGFSDAQIRQLCDFAIGTLEWAVAHKRTRTAARMTDVTTDFRLWEWSVIWGDTDDDDNSDGLDFRRDRLDGWLARLHRWDGSELRWLFPGPLSLAEIWVTAVCNAQPECIPAIVKELYGVEDVSLVEIGVADGLASDAGWNGTYRDALLAARAIVATPGGY